MLAGVGYVLMGAGIPLEIPAALAALSGHQPASLSVRGRRRRSERRRPHRLRSGGARIGPGRRSRSRCPTSSRSSPRSRWRRSCSSALRDRLVDGFIVEAPAAGGHNAPPRGAAALRRQRPAALRTARRGRSGEAPRARASRSGSPAAAAGRARSPKPGASAPTASRSGPRSPSAASRASIRSCAARSIARIAAGTAVVRTDPRASPTGFPFKVVDLPGTLSEEAVYEHAGAGLQSRLPEERLPPRRRADRLSLRRRAGRGVRHQGWRGGADGGAQVPLQQPARQRLPRRAASPRRSPSRRCSPPATISTHCDSS